MAKKASGKWHGWFPAIVTPFDEEGRIDEAGFRRNIQLLIRDGVHGIVATGATGEYWSLTDEERKRLFEAAHDEASGRVTVVGGATAVTTGAVIALAEHARKIGMDGIMVAPPPGTLPKRRELLAHFKAISDAVDIDIMPYNQAERYGVNMSPQLISELADIEHVVAVKESCSSFQQQIETLRLAGDRIAIMGGWAAMRALPSIVMGVDGLVGSEECQVAGRRCRELWDCAHSGNIERAREIQMLLIDFHQNVIAAFGTEPAPLKAALNLLRRPGGFPRKPILPLTPDEIRVVDMTLKRLEILPEEV